jgi:PRTRC genetic system protein B
MSDLFDNSHVSGAVYFTDQGHFLVKLKKDGGCMVKNVREADVTAAFTHSSKDSGWLPKGIVRVGNTARGPWFVYVEKPEKRKIKLEKIGEITIPVPMIIFIGANGRYRIFAAAESTFSPDGLLYLAPFPNVDSNGSICWGNNEQPKSNPIKAPAAMDLFFRAPFSSHWGNGKSKTHSADIRELLQTLDGKDQYPVKDLVSCNLTTSRLVDSIIRGREQWN